MITSKEELVFYDFILAFFRFQGILYTKIGIDELDELRAYLFRLMHDYFGQIDNEVNKRDDINKLIHLSLCTIFIAHATIAESIKDKEKRDSKRLKTHDDEELKSSDYKPDS